MTSAKLPISIVIADDHPVVLRGITALLESNSDLSIVAACPDGTAALDAVRKLAPDIAVLDIAMPGLSGLEVLTAIGAERLETKTILLTVAAEDSQILTAVASGARAVLLKDTAPDELVRCIRDVAVGRSWLPGGTIAPVLERETGRQTEAMRIIKALTRRELQVMMLVSEGLSNKEVARRLTMSEGTVKIHLHNIYQKVGARNRTILTMLAIAHRDQLISASDMK